MNLEEIKNLKHRIDYNIDELHKKDLKAAVISDAFDILLEKDANQSFIDTWLKTIGNEVNSIVIALDEIEKKPS